MSPSNQKPITPESLSKAQLAEFVAGLSEMMFGDVDDAGKEVWNPDMEINGGDLIEWLCEEMRRLNLTPLPGPRE
jgi:hypothetical protein